MSITHTRFIYAWLGQWRDKMPPEAVSDLQDVLGPMSSSQEPPPPAWPLISSNITTLKNSSGKETTFADVAAFVRKSVESEIALGLDMHVALGLIETIERQQGKAPAQSVREELTSLNELIVSLEERGKAIARGQRARIVKPPDMLRKSIRDEVFAITSVYFDRGGPYISFGNEDDMVSLEAVEFVSE